MQYLVNCEPDLFLNMKWIRFDTAIEKLVVCCIVANSAHIFVSLVGTGKEEPKVPVFYFGRAFHRPHKDWSSVA